MDTKVLIILSEKERVEGFSRARLCDDQGFKVFIFKIQNLYTLLAVASNEWICILFKSRQYLETFYRLKLSLLYVKCVKVFELFHELALLE